MKLFERNTEIKFLAGVCSGQKSAALFWGKVNETHFHTPPGKELYQLIKRAVKSDGQLPTYLSIKHDPRLSSGTKALFKKFTGDKASMQGLLSGLQRHREGRLAYDSGRYMIEQLQTDNVDTKELLREVANRIAAINLSNGTQLHHFGHGSNVGSKVRKLLEGKVVKAIPTGFKSFDNQNMGILRESVMTLTANTGGLKSAMAQQIWMNSYLAGYNTLYISLEMPFEECVFRLFGKLTGIEQSKWMHATSSPKERRIALKKYEEFEAAGKKSKKRATILSVVDSDLTFDEVAGTIQANSPDIVILDYMSLLADADSQDQWKVLSKIARKCKMLARKLKCVFILLMQMNEDESMRYSKGPSEHADYWWSWILSEKERETGMITVRQRKCRKGALFPFMLSVDLGSGQITDPIDQLATSGTKKFKPPVPMEEVTDGADQGGYYEE